MRVQRFLLAVGAILLFLSSIGSNTPTAQAVGRQCFAQTNQCIEGRFQEYWNQNGGLAVFGYPISDAHQERNHDTGKDYLTQWFQRNRFEYHPENAAPYDVLLGRLGDDRLRGIGIDWQKEPHDSGPRSGCLWFPQTKFNVCDQDPKDGTAQAGFMSYWQTEQLRDTRLDAYGRSLALFGLPLSQARIETNTSGDTVLTQWFERARLEWHPNNPAGYRVLLGLLGNELQASASTRPSISYLAGGRLYQVDAEGKIQKRQDIPTMGNVLDAVERDGEIILLRGQGLQAITSSGTARSIATFTKGTAEIGKLIAPANSDQIIYAYNRAAPMPQAFEAVVGLTDGMTARKVFDAANNLRILGFSTDAKAMFVIFQGGDPAFTQVKVVQIPTGEILASLPFAGDGAVAESPDRTLIATIIQRNGHTDTLTFYDLSNQTGAPRNVVLERKGWDIRDIIWSRNSRSVYATVYPDGYSSTGELWKVDRDSRQSKQIAAKLPADTHLLSISPDSRWLLAQTNQGALVIDLTTGTSQTVSLDQNAVIASWH